MRGIHRDNQETPRQQTAPLAASNDRTRPETKGETLDIRQTAGGVALAFALTWLAVHALIPHAARLGLLDYPTGRKAHLHPTPVIGGLAMLFAALAATLIAFDPPGRATLGFGLAAILLVITGVIDDRRDISWRARIVVQVAAALLLIHVGGIRIEQVGNLFGTGSFALGTLSVPFTVFATVGILNAINMIDGEDGLAGTQVLAALVMLCAAAVYSGNVTVFQRAAVVAGAVAGFLVFNLRFPGRTQARIFMGNAGSALLGLVIACFTFRLTQNPAHPVGPILALWLIPLPIMDCLVLMVRRLRSGRSPFAADRGHIHHLMGSAGHGPLGISIVLAGFSFATGLCAAIALRLHVPQILLVLAFVLLCLGYYWLTSRHERAIAFFRRLRPRRAMSSPDVELANSKETGA